MKFLGYLARIAGSVERRIERAQQQESDGYLAGAADHADLELRLRELERAPVWIPHYG